MGRKNGCVHSHTYNTREGDDLVTRCKACGAETARTKDFYK
jgi:hypothetical protein